MKKFILLFFSVLILSASLSIAQDGRPQYKIRNERAGVYIGDIVIELLPYVAPKHTAYFDSLVAISFYDSIAWHRVVPNFVIQGGDPNSKHGPRNTWGEGDSTQTNIPAEFSKVDQVVGIIGAARDTDINSANSQFYINTANNSSLTSSYTSYGIVIEGMDVVEDIEASPRDGNDNPLEKIEMFITKIGVNESIPDAPTLLEPIDNYNGFTQGTNIVWTPDSTSVLSFLEIANDEQFNDIVFADSFGVAGANTSIKFSGAELGQVTYYWRVRCNNGAKFGDYSETRSFTTSILPPELTAPEYNATGVTRNPLLDWEPVEGAVTYRVQLVKTLPNFSDSRLLLDESGLGETELQLNDLEANTRYYWRVLCETVDYDTPYSEVWIFTTEDVTGVAGEELPTKYSLSQNYPNPFNPSTTIKFSIPQDVKGKMQDVKLVVYDIIGKVIAVLLDAQIAAGYHEVSFDASKLSSGIYFYKLEAGNFVSTKKMILMK